MDRISCDYLKPIRLGDDISMSVSIAGVGTKSFTFRYSLHRSDDESLLYGRGESVMVMYDYARGETVSIARELSEKLAEYLE